MKMVSSEKAKERLDGIDINLKYDIQSVVPHDIYVEPPKAIEVLDRKVGQEVSNVVDQIKDDIGDVILAVNSLRHPSKTVVIDTVEKGHTARSNITPKNNLLIKWTYVIQGKGIGRHNNTKASSKAIHDLHKVLIEGDNSPIRRKTAIREFDPGPFEIKTVTITT